jgi:hypothetical protein
VPDDTDIKYVARPPRPPRTRQNEASRAYVESGISRRRDRMPCSNPSSGPGPERCDNFRSGGGADRRRAVLAAASGATLPLRPNNLVFTSSGEKPTATSLVLQGTSSRLARRRLRPGRALRRWTLKRLFTRRRQAGASPRELRLGRCDASIRRARPRREIRSRPGQVAGTFVPSTADPHRCSAGCPAGMHVQSLTARRKSSPGPRDQV